MLKQEDPSPTPEFVASIKESIQQHVDPHAPTTKKGKQFLEWAVTKLFNASEDDFEQHYTDGVDDHGIDFWISDPSDDNEGGVIQIFQCKYGTSHKPESIYEFRDKVKKFFKMDPYKIEREQLKDIIGEKRQKKLESELIYVTNNNVENPEDYEEVIVYGFQQIVEKLWDDLFGKPRGQKGVLKLESSMHYENSVMGAVSLQELSRFVRKNKSYIFESNIRKFLGSKKTKVNKLLQKTINENPEDVFKYNNGITMVAKKIVDLGNHEFEFHEPQIVNGAQTASTISTELQFYDNRRGSVPITIFEEEAKLVKDKITRFRNTQNAVKGKDLISLEATHHNIHAQIKNVGYYYEYQAGGWISLSEKEKQQFTGHKDYNKYLPDVTEKRIDAKDAIQAMVAGIFQNPTKPYGSVARYMPGGSNYHEVFNVDLNENYKLFLYPYLVKSYCKEKFHYGEQDADRPEMKYARLLFVTAYFRILSQFILKKNFEQIMKDPDILEHYFTNFKSNSELLGFTNEVLDHYFATARGYYKKHKVTTWHNFFSRHAWDEQLQEEFINFVNVHISKLKEIQEHFKKSS